MRPCSITSSSLYRGSRKSPANTLIGLLFILFLHLPGIARAGTDDSCQITESDLGAASDIVLQLHNSLLAVMQDAEKLGYSGRYEMLEPVITNSFNTPLITRTILGSRYWDTMSEQQKNDFTRAPSLCFDTHSQAKQPLEYGGSSGSLSVLPRCNC